MKTLREQLKECYPYAELDNWYKNNLLQFTVDDMIEFAITIQQEQQKLIAENAKVDNLTAESKYEVQVDKSSILNENNIIK